MYMFYIGLILICCSIPWMIQSHIVLAIAAIVMGSLLMTAGRNSKKKKMKSDAATSLSKGNFCSNCNVNVSGNTTKCPICGNELRRN